MVETEKLRPSAARQDGKCAVGTAVAGHIPQPPTQRGTTGRQADVRANGLNAGLLSRRATSFADVAPATGSRSSDATTTDSCPTEERVHAAGTTRARGLTDVLLVCFCAGRKERRRPEKGSRQWGGSPMRDQVFASESVGLGTHGAFGVGSAPCPTALGRTNSEDDFWPEGMWADVQKMRETGPEAYGRFEGKPLAELGREVAAAFSEVQVVMQSSRDSSESPLGSLLGVTSGVCGTRDDPNQRLSCTDPALERRGELQAAPVGFFANLLDAIDDHQVTLEEAAGGGAASTRRNGSADSVDRGVTF